MEKDNRKFVSDNTFNENGGKYYFKVYPTKKAADLDENGSMVMTWNNNDITRHEAQLILMGLASTARLKWTHPVAVLYYCSRDGYRNALSRSQ